MKCLKLLSVFALCGSLYAAEQATYNKAVLYGSVGVGATTQNYKANGNKKSSGAGILSAEIGVSINEQFKVKADTFLSLSDGNFFGDSYPYVSSNLKPLLYEGTPSDIQTDYGAYIGYNLLSLAGFKNQTLF
ncbi:hypothetical protein CCZ01_09300 [Helicobacter monodelphidis]|uniref:hypothetical protein n=1 Tax=Helicobacter sp. 15-1451 TaxID=2004995 RepID=UPI000DCCDA5B|nr:hypothetical protein [Helicobacter sp. 15-1451]RAX56509.1 hypothetical protein CCZ01_09300 [Helicobacter sp. 15-1451]